MKKLTAALIFCVFITSLILSGCDNEKTTIKNDSDNSKQDSETSDSDSEDKDADDVTNDGETGDDSDDSSGSNDDETGNDDEQAVNCENIPTAPIKFETHSGFTGSEDFAFDKDGNLVSVEMDTGNLVKQKRDGSKKLMVPGVGEASGIRILKDGTVVIAVGQTIVKIDTEGSMSTFVSGFTYPNGLALDKDDNIFVSDLDEGKIFKINPKTGDKQLIADNLIAPNGLSFSPDYKTLFCVSFGAGIVYSIKLNENGEWQNAEEFAKTPDAPENPGGIRKSCENSQEGDSCTKEGVLGACKSDSSELFCDLEASKAACSGKNWNDPCTVAGKNGYCVESWDDYSVFICISNDIREGGENGGLDGLGVDACGYIYVTEYVVGKIWRFTPDGSKVELLFDPPTSWVPNLHWGNGKGGWDTKTLYVMDRDGGNLYSVPLGIPSK